jgi:acyl-ACP thioesterase
MAMLYPRYFFITDSKGEVIVRSSSIWALIDNSTRRVIVDRDVISKLPEEKYDDQLPLPEKISLPDDNRFIEKRTIHYSDLDFNSHMNNVRYVELVTDTHDSAFYKNHHIKSINLNYMKEIKEKEAVEIFTDASNPETISVNVNGSLAFLGKVTYSD